MKLLVSILGVVVLAACTVESNDDLESWEEAGATPGEFRADELEDFEMCIEIEIGTICPHFPENITDDFVECGLIHLRDTRPCKGVCGGFSAYYLIPASVDDECCDCR